MLSRLSDRLWEIAHRRYAAPQLTVVRPVSEWTLPAGYSLDDATGNIRNEAGAVLSNPSAYMTTVTVPVVPGLAHIGTDILPADITPDDVVMVAVRYGDVATVRTAQYVIYQGETYDVVDSARLSEAQTGRMPAHVTLHRRRDDKRSTWSQWDRRWTGQ